MLCGEAYTVRVDRVKARGSRYCSVRCGALAASPHLEHSDPDLFDFLEVGFSHCKSNVLASLVGFTEQRLERLATRCGWHKDPNWMRENRLFALRGCRRDRTPLRQSDPDLFEFIEQVYPFAVTSQLADFVGIPQRRIRRLAWRNNWLKDTLWLRENGMTVSWDGPPELREVVMLTRRLKGEATIREKALSQ